MSSTIVIDWADTSEVLLPNGRTIRDCDGDRPHACVYDGTDFLGDIEVLALGVDYKHSRPYHPKTCGEGRPLPPDPQEVARQAAPGPDRRPAASPARPVPGLLQRGPAPSGARTANTGPGLRRAHQGNAPPAGDRRPPAAPPYCSSQPTATCASSPKKASSSPSSPSTRPRTTNPETTSTTDVDCPGCLETQRGALGSAPKAPTGGATMLAHQRILRRAVT